MSNEILKRILSSIFILPISVFFIIKGSLFFIIFILLIYILIIYEWYLMSNKKKYFVPGLIFILISGLFTYLFRGNTLSDLYTFLIVILICVSTDIGGYLFGNIFKGPKLAKKISPNKTISGMFGSYLFSILIFYIAISYSNLISIELNYVFNKFNVLYIIIISTISQLGDLLISLFKRISKIKHTSNILPGHGGLLDRFDGMIFAIPFAYLFLNIL